MIRRALLTSAGALALWACCLFNAPPTVGPEPQPGPHVFRYIVGGDSRDDFVHVLPWSFSEARARGALAFIFLGDMELTPQLDVAFAKDLPLLGSVKFYPALGNHEIKVLGTFPIDLRGAENAYKARFLGTDRTPVRSVMADRVAYSVDLPGGVHYAALDNVTAEDFGAPQLVWLEADLAQAQAEGRTILVGMHRPLAGNGVTTHCMAASSDSDRALAIFVRHGVSLILASHEHLYAHFTQGASRATSRAGWGRRSPPVRSELSTTFSRSTSTVNVST